MVEWRKVAVGVAAATIGAATFGAVHFMFLAPQWGVGDIMGIPLTVLLPFLLGTLGFIGAAVIGRKYGDTPKQILLYGSAATVGFGVAQYAGWVTTPAVVAPGAALRARAPTRYVPTTIPRTLPIVTPTVGAKVI